LRLFATIFLASAAACHAGESAAGRWEGSAQIPGGDLRLIVDLAQDQAQQWIGSIIVPGLGVKGAPLADISVNDSEIAFSIKGALGSERAGQTKLKAHLTPDSRLTGEFMQGGNNAPLGLEKMGPPQVELPPRNTVVSKQIEGEWKGDYELNGYPRHVTMKFANRGTEGASVEFVIVGKNTNNVPVSLLTQEGDFLSLKSDEFRMSYEGRVEKESRKISGTLSQGPIEVPLVMQRIQ
jgi:hypothetical protein